MNAPQSPKKVTPIRILIVVIVLAATVFFGRLALLSTTRPEWVFDGAYAEYYGSGELQTGTPYTYNMTITVLSYNASAAEILSRENITIGSESSYNENTSWASYGGGPPIDTGAPGTNYQPPYTMNTTLLHIDGKNIETTSSYYNYSLDNGTDLVTLFSSQSMGFPLAWSATLHTAKISGEINTYLTKTNIPGLMP